jgi:peptidoglycan/LPS O-acetylase OafA/YrhL
VLVVLHHASATLAKYTGVLVGDSFFQGIGRAGVDFFFVLSGFIIYYVHNQDVGRPATFGAYAAKRAIRIYPIYWVVLLPLIAVYLLNPSFGNGNENELGKIVKSFILFPADDRENLLILSPAWTLAHEVVFYAVFGLAILSRRVGRVVVSVWLGLLFVALFTPRSPYPFDFFLHVKNIEFFLGAATANLVLARRFVPSWRVGLAGALVFVGTGLAEYGSFPFTRSPLTLGYGAGALLMILWIVAGEKQHRLALLLGPLALIGDASYSIYLSHLPMLSVMIKAGSALGLLDPAFIWVDFLAATVLAVFAGLCFYVLIERNLLRFLRLRTITTLKPPRVVKLGKTMPVPDVS